MPLRIGLTGGIGSGKSTVAKVFEVLGIPVYYADTEAKRLMNEDPVLKKQISDHFGEKVYASGTLDRRKLATMVFNDREKLNILNGLVHPVTIRDGEEWMQRQATPYALKEAALIFEGGVHEYLDYVIGVSAPAPLRIQRAMNRDAITREDVLARMNKQIDEVIKMRLCDFLIYNDEQQAVLPQVLALHEKLVKLSATSASPMPL
jgi:dephospho-CoA kinase